jgi:hypothetical protein
MRQRTKSPRVQGLYCAEFLYRRNERKVTDAARTMKALTLIGGGRVMYKDPIRKRA